MAEWRIVEPVDGGFRVEGQVEGEWRMVAGEYPSLSDAEKALKRWLAGPKTYRYDDKGDPLVG